MVAHSPSISPPASMAATTSFLSPWPHSAWSDARGDDWRMRASHLPAVRGSSRSGRGSVSPSPFPLGGGSSLPSSGSSNVALLHSDPLDTDSIESTNQSGKSSPEQDKAPGRRRNLRITTLPVSPAPSELTSDDAPLYHCEWLHPYLDQVREPMLRSRPRHSLQIPSLLALDLLTRRSCFRRWDRSNSRRALLSRDDGYQAKLAAHIREVFHLVPGIRSTPSLRHSVASKIRKQRDKAETVAAEVTYTMTGFIVRFLAHPIYIVWSRQMVTGYHSHVRDYWNELRRFTLVDETKSFACFVASRSVECLFRYAYDFCAALFRSCAGDKEEQQEEEQKMEKPPRVVCECGEIHSEDEFSEEDEDQDPDDEEDMDANRFNKETRVVPRIPPPSIWEQIQPRLLICQLLAYPFLRMDMGSRMTMQFPNWSYFSARPSWRTAIVVVTARTLVQAVVDKYIVIQLDTFSPRYLTWLSDMLQGVAWDALATFIHLVCKFPLDLMIMEVPRVPAKVMISATLPYMASQFGLILGATLVMNVVQLGIKRFLLRVGRTKRWPGYRLCDELGASAETQLIVLEPDDDPAGSTSQ